MHPAAFAPRSRQGLEAGLRLARAWVRLVNSKKGQPSTYRGPSVSVTRRRSPERSTRPPPTACGRIWTSGSCCARPRRTWRAVGDTSTWTAPATGRSSTHRARPAFQIEGPTCECTHTPPRLR